MTGNKKELAVAALKNGTVIDHIPSEALFAAVRILGIENISKSVTIGNNLHSNRLGTKGIIKVADTAVPIPNVFPTTSRCRAASRLSTVTMSISAVITAAIT